MLRRLVLFDIDGTLLSTAGAGRRAITRALGHEFAAVAFNTIRFDGKTDPQIVGELLDAAGRVGPHDDAAVQAVCERYVALLAGELLGPAADTQVMPGVHALLDTLERRPDVLLGLLTGNVARGASLKLRAAGIAPDRFALGAFGSDSPVRGELPAIAAQRAEPHFGRLPRAEEIVIVGDTPADIDCGRALQARAIAVATGAYSAPELAEHGPFALFHDLTDTDAIVEAIIG